MAFLLSCQEVSKSYGSRPLFRDITLGVEEGERLGLIGPNGSGKSTLLKLLGGHERPDTGVVSARRLLRLGYVPQQDQFPAGATVQQVLLAALSDQPYDEHEREVQVSIMLGRIGFPNADQPADTLSGGWKKRLALARELIREPELLLIDEPTNHLDLEGILWLEGLLKSAPFAFVLVSHDRYFLQNVTNRVVELNPAYAEGYLSVKGSYADFLVHREEYLQGQQHQQVALASKVRREVEWLRQGAPARSTKSSARIQQAGRLIDELSDVKHRNAQGKAAGIDFDATGRRTKDLLTAEGISQSLGGRTLFSKLDLILSPKRKLGLIGVNGSGKTTLLRVLTGDLEPEEGTVRRADDLQVVLFDQSRAQLDRSLSLKEALAPSGGDTVIYRGAPMHVAAWAKRFLFRPELLEMKVGYLSGGEQARVLIARLMLQPADLLILDEPTNDLDIPTLEVLEESLLEFPGALVLVTHDRFLLDRVATEILALDGRGGHRFLADYHQWEAVRRRDEQEQANAVKATAVRTSAATPARRLSTTEQRELSRMEEKIEKAEAEVAGLEARMAEPAIVSDHLKVQETWKAVQAAQAKVAELYARWEELEAKRSN